MTGSTTAPNGVRGPAMARQNLVVRGKYALFLRQWPSNWEASPFVIDGVTYTCVEQWMMAVKARVFGDDDALTAIMATSDPGTQKNLGRAVRGYVEATWAAVRYDVVLRGTLEKYRQNEWLRHKLLATGDLILVEANPRDLIWGIGMRADEEGADDPTRWRGQNLLGRVLMDAREILRAEEST